MKGGDNMNMFQNLSKENMYTICILGRFFATILQMATLFYLLILRYINVIEFIIINILILVIQILLIKKQKTLTE